LFIALGGALGGNLRRPAQSFQEARDVVFVVHDRELASDDLADAGTSPDLAAKAVCLSPV